MINRIKMTSNKKSNLYTHYPLSSVLIYNGTTVVHYVLGGIGIILGYGSWIGYALGSLYLAFSFIEMYVHMPLKVCCNCVYYKLDNSRCISGLNIISRKIAKEGSSFTDFREYRDEIEAERAKLNDLVEIVKARRNLVKADFNIALNLANQLDFLFEKGTFPEKRLLCETVFKRIYIEDGKIIENPELNSPFGLISSVASSSGCFQLGSGGWI